MRETPSGDTEASTDAKSPVRGISSARSGEADDAAPSVATSAASAPTDPARRPVPTPRLDASARASDPSSELGITIQPL